MVSLHSANLVSKPFGDLEGASMNRQVKLKKKTFLVPFYFITNIPQSKVTEKTNFSERVGPKVTVESDNKVNLPVGGVSP